MHDKVEFVVDICQVSLCQVVISSRSKVVRLEKTFEALVDDRCDHGLNRFLQLLHALFHCLNDLLEFLFV